MKSFTGNTLSWELVDGVVELGLHRQPNNEIGSATLEELERFVEALQAAQIALSRHRPVGVRGCVPGVPRTMGQCI